MPSRLMRLPIGRCASKNGSSPPSGTTSSMSLQLRKRRIRGAGQVTTMRSAKLCRSCAKRIIWIASAAPLSHHSSSVWPGGSGFPSHSGAAEAIQMIRFAHDLHSFAERIVVTCPAPLMRLFRSCKDIDEVVPLGGELPFFDAHLPMGSLINRLGITVDTVTSDPYLASDPARRELFAPFLAGPGFKVGLAWSADPGMRGPLLAELAAERHDLVDVLAAAEKAHQGRGAGDDDAFGEAMQIVREADHLDCFGGAAFAPQQQRLARRQRVPVPQRRRRSNPD